MNKSEKLILELQRFAGTKQSYRNKRCGRYVEGIRDSLQVVQEGTITGVMKEDSDYFGNLKSLKKKKKKK